MSVNHFQSDVPATFIWPQHLQQHPTMENQPYSQQFNPQIYTHQNQRWLLSNFNLNRENNVEDDEIDDITRTEDGEEGDGAGSRDEWEETADKQSMFEKALTPSDVGKLNRLVIPKQHAEKYFPLGDGGDSGDKGLLLSFEDEAGKSWRFRYSYWNSSQSYVLTKGWSRYVKEKRLASGDVVFFQRHRTNGERLFIGWRRRQAQRTSSAVMAQEGNGNGKQGSGGWTRLFYSAHPYPEQSHHPDHQLRLHHYHPAPYQPDCFHAGSVSGHSAPASVGNSKILRLFGVNMECQTDVSDDPSTPSPSLLTKSATPNHQFFPQHISSNPANHSDLTFSKDVINRMRNRRG